MKSDLLETFVRIIAGLVRLDILTDLNKNYQLKNGDIQSRDRAREKN